MKKDSQVDEVYFRDMLRATTALRIAQEDEAAIHQRINEHRQALRETEGKLTNSSQRFNSIKAGGMQKLSGDQLLSKLQVDVKCLYDHREVLTATVTERSQHLEKLNNWTMLSDRAGTYEDVQAKKEQLREIQNDIKQVQTKLDVSENASKLAVFRQAATLAEKKLRERQEEFEIIATEQKVTLQLIQEKEASLTNINIDTNTIITVSGTCTPEQDENHQLRVRIAKKSTVYKEQHYLLGGQSIYFYLLV